MPLAESLAKIAEEHFGFASAVSGELGEESSTAGDLPARLKALEQSVSSISEILKTLAAAQSAAAPRAPALRAQPKVRSVPPAAADVETPCGLGHRRDLRAAAAEWSSPTQLGMEVMRSARLAGIPEEQIVEMARLASMGRPKLSDFPASQRKQLPSNVLSESEDDEPGPQEQDPLQDGSPAPTGADVAITQAVTKLTEIAAHLTAQKKQEKSLDALLDGVGSGGSGETAGVPGHRK